MPSGMYKSRTLRRIKKRTPGGKLVTHYKKRRPSEAICANCKKPLAGVPRERPYKLKKLAKSSRRPERAYGGTYCSACTKRIMIERARAGM